MAQETSPNVGSARHDSAFRSSVPTPPLVGSGTCVRARTRGTTASARGRCAARGAGGLRAARAPGQAASARASRCAAPRRRPQCAAGPGACPLVRRACRREHHAGHTRIAARTPPSCVRRQGAPRDSRARVQSGHSPASPVRACPSRSRRHAVSGVPSVFSVPGVRAGVVGNRMQDRLDTGRLHLRDAARANRLLDLGDRRGAHLLPRRQPLAETQVGDVAVAVVGRLREDGEHELRERVAVGAHQRDAVHLPQAFADPHDPCA